MFQCFGKVLQCFGNNNKQGRHFTNESDDYFQGKMLCARLTPWREGGRTVAGAAIAESRFPEEKLIIQDHHDGHYHDGDDDPHRLNADAQVCQP